MWQCTACVPGCWDSCCPTIQLAPWATLGAFSAVAAAHNIVYSSLCAGVQALPWHDICAFQPLGPSRTLCLAADTYVSCSGAFGADPPDHSLSVRVAAVLVATPWPTGSGHLAHVGDITGATAAIIFRCLQGSATWCPPARHGAEDRFGHGEGSSFLAFQEDCSF